MARRLIQVTATGSLASANSVAALAVTTVSKTFGTQRVLRDVDITVAPGEIRALVGENGSGKSTLVKVLAGFHTPDAGSTVSVAGEPLTLGDPEASDVSGLRFVHQDLALIDTLSVVENLGLGRGYDARRAAPVRWRNRRRDAARMMGDLGYDVDLDNPVSTLAPSERTALAVARAVSPHRSVAKILVLDEPTANLPGPEVDKLFSLVRRVRDQGVAVVFISHHLSEVFDLADSVTVLRGGALVTTKLTSDLDEPELIRLMVGRSVERSHRSAPASRADSILSASRMGGGSLRAMDLDVAAGEIVGVAGITGSGREAVAELLFGSCPRTGDVHVNGSLLASGRPDLSIAAGMGLIPADRAHNAAVHGHDVSENISIARPHDFRRRGMVSRKLERREVSSWMSRLDIRPFRPNLPLSQLSGGNAQKVILARWLRLRPAVLVLDEPTQGVDIGAREDIYHQLERSAAEGCAIVVCSTDGEELARVCTRVLVLNRGHVVAELAAPTSSDDITTAALTTSGASS